MISTKEHKDIKMTPQERKEKVSQLREEHEDYFQTSGNINGLFIPKMAYRPTGKDELYISFFPSELQKNKDIYTEFVSIDYDTEDPKRTLYLWEYNNHWEEEYELITSSNGFERHIIPVAELKVINDVTSRNGNKYLEEDPFEEITESNEKIDQGVVKALNSIAYYLQDISESLKKNKK